MSSIFNGQFNKNTTDDQKRAYQSHEDREVRSKYQYKEAYKSINISKILEDKIPLASGGTITIKPAEIADSVKLMMDEMMRDPKYDFIKPYIQKPVIWTYEIGAALTDGIRIYMSPVFAATLLSSNPRTGMGGKEAEEFWQTLTPAEQRDSKNRSQYRMMKTKYVRFVIIHEIYHIIYNHVRRGILKYGSNPTKQEHDVANISMDLEINRDIESTFPDLKGSTEAIGAIWYMSEKFFNKNNKPFLKDIWEDIWDDFMNRNKDFNISDPFANEGANPTQQDNRQQGPFADGWRKAIDAIKGKMIDPRTFNIPEGNGTFSEDDLKDALNKIINAGTDENDADNED